MSKSRKASEGGAADTSYIARDFYQQGCSVKIIQVPFFLNFVFTGRAARSRLD